MSMHALHLSRWVVVAVATTLLSCQMVQTAAQSASTIAEAANSGSERSGIDAQGTLQTILAAILTGVREIFQEQQRMEQWVLATLEPIAYADHALNVGIPAAIDLLCASPGPDDLAPPGAEITYLYEADEDELVRLVVGGDLAPSADDVDNTVAVEAVIEASPTSEDAVMTIRGGGALFCAILASELYVDGEPLRLESDAAESLDADLQVRLWPEDAEIHEPGSTLESEELPNVEVTLQFTLPVEVLAELLTAEELTFWMGDIAAVELYPAISETAAQLREHLVGPEEPDEPEIPQEIIEQLEREALLRDETSP
jgi:hypothetical protein